MGFDIVGRNPKNDVGGYFGVNCWWWRPLAIYVLENVPMSPNETKYWGSNDGQKVSEKTARRISKRLNELIKSGHTKEWEMRLMRSARRRGDENCGFDVETVQDFADFCKYSGGFEIC